MGEVVQTQNITIASGSSLSDSINFNGRSDGIAGLRLFGIVMPATWTSASLTFQASYNGGTTWVDVYDVNGNELTVTAAASRCIVMIPDAIAAISNIKLRSGTSAAPVNQAADRSLMLILSR